MTSMSDQERERVWELHTSSEFDTLDLDTTMANWDQTTVLAQTDSSPRRGWRGCRSWRTSAGPWRTARSIS